MYSGGKDSTNLLCTVSKAYPNAELTLLVCNNGHFYPKEIQNIILRNTSAVKKAGISAKQRIVYLDCREILINLGMRSLHEI